MAAKAKIPDSAIVFLKIAGGLVLGAALASLTDFAIRGLIGKHGEYTDLWAIDQIVRAVIAAFAAFWIRAYTDNIIVKPQASADKVRLRADGELFIYCMFAALSVLMAARIVVDGVSEVYREVTERRVELLVMNYDMAPKPTPDSVKDLTKVSWHFFFEEGGLCRHKGCDPRRAALGSRADICAPANIAVHGAAIDSVQAVIRAASPKLDCEDGPFDDRGRCLGTSLQGLKDAEAVDRLSKIVTMAAQCAMTSGEDPADMLVLLAGASNRGWEECTNDERLNKALAEQRAARMTSLFEDAKGRAIQSASGALRAEIGKIRLTRREPSDLLDFSDLAFTRSDVSEGLREGGKAGVSPYMISQYAAIVLDNPKGCVLVRENSRSADRKEETGQAGG